MKATLFERIWFRCSHQFSWPRRAADGSYYQVCLRCGSRYSYDWSRMRRLARLQEQSGEEIGAPMPEVGATKSTGIAWQPRQRRLKVQVPVLFRTGGTAEWLEGTTCNISRSGLLFRFEPQSGKPVEPGNALEFIFEMPAEISGQHASRVRCEGVVARCEAKEQSSQILVAVTIAGYEFLQDPKVVRFWGHRNIRKRHA